MRIALVLCLLAVVGCGRGSETAPQHLDLLCECFSQAAYEVIRAERAAAVVPEEPTKHCGQCGKNGLPKGKMLSGDRLSVVPCPCPDTCECKQPTAICKSGTCRK